MANILAGGSDFDKLSDLFTRSYKDQAVWFLNAFWDEFAGKEAENVWKFVHTFNELDLQKKEQGNELDELNAHRFLERFHETMTVLSMREKLRSTGAIKEERGRKYVSITHYLLVKYNVDWHALVNAPQGSKEELEKAQKVFQEVQAAFKEAEARKEAATAALKEATAREAEAKSSEAEAKAREGEARAAQDELEAALNALKAAEEAHNNKTAQLQKASEEGGLVSRNKAKAELAQHLSADPLPLRRAKLTQEAAVNKAEKATKVAAEARAVAEQAAVEASQARAESEEATRKSEAAVEEATKKVQEAEEYLEKAKNYLPKGSTWWLEREIHEAKAYLPKHKGGYQKPK